VQNDSQIKVLLIDDDTSVRLGISILLKKAGIKALVAATVSEALAIWKEEREAIDVLLVDIMMPVQSGPELVRELFRVREARPVVFMTGIAPAQASDVTKDIAEAAILQKPFSFQALVEVIHRLAPRGKPAGAV
jgi:FixJ family two-component response regulator